MRITNKLEQFAAVCIFVLLAGSAYADGNIYFQNTVTSRIYLFNDAVISSNLVTSATLGSQDPGGYGSTGVLDAGLVWGTTASSVSTIYGGTLAGIENIGVSISNPVGVPGELAGNPLFDVPGTVAGDSYYFQVYFWDSSFGNSLAGLQACVAAGGYFGAASAGAANQTYGAVGVPLYILLNPSNGPGTIIFGATGSLFGRTVILDAPEPGTVLLAGVGGAALLLLYRRRLRA
jgi:hypothetical protein